MAERYAYYLNSEFVYNDYVKDYICQIELPYSFYKEKFGLPLLDEPLACYKSVYLSDTVKGNNFEVTYSEHHIPHDETNAELTRLIMKEK